MNVGQCMSKDVQLCSPSDTISSAATTMRIGDMGFMPVGDGDRLVGMITDRDIAMRAVAEKRAPDTSVGDVMTRDVHYCFEEDDIETASEKMSALQVRRLPVLNRDKRLVGVISLGDIARSGDPENTGETLGAISTPAIQSH